ncbi:MAG TPA: aa3-type cytochrome c oxidase subunit IV [Caulobacteraceae bacterium]|nr:aa3-type cytochrome c oxidase subunit IV [Caulobacteraceae bacterium]
MAEHHDAHHDTEYHRGEMDISEQAATYDLFMALTKWGSLLTAVSLVFLTIWFATDFGFLAAAGAGVILLVAGIVFLRKKPGQH